MQKSSTGRVQALRISETRPSGKMWCSICLLLHRFWRCLPYIRPEDHSTWLHYTTKHMNEHAFRTFYNRLRRENITSGIIDCIYEGFLHMLINFANTPLQTSFYSPLLNEDIFFTCINSPCMGQPKRLIKSRSQSWIIYLGHSPYDVKTSSYLLGQH